MKIIHSKSDGSKTNKWKSIPRTSCQSAPCSSLPQQNVSASRIRQFPTLHAEWFRQKRETLHLLIMGKLLLQGIDTGTEQRLYLGMLQ